MPRDKDLYDALDVAEYKYHWLGPSTLTITVYPRGKQYENLETIIELG